MTVKRSWLFGNMLGALAAGCAVAFLPSMTSNLAESGLAGLLKTGTECLELPGAMVVIIAGRSVHAISLWAVEASNVILYSGLFYFLLYRWAKHKQAPTATASQ